MRIVRPAPLHDRTHLVAKSIIQNDSIIRAAHLIPVYGTRPVARELRHYHSLDAFDLFYVNKFADHHAFDMLHQLQ